MIDDPALAALDCAETVRDLVRRVAEGIARLLEDNLIGIYLHGSLAMGCYTEEASDIDLLVLTDGPVAFPVLREVGHLMLKASERAPAKGFEMSVVDKRTTTPFVHPAPFLLHYSDTFRDDFRSGTVDFSKPRTDPDLAAHFTMARSRGVRLAGEPIDHALAPVPEEAFRDSIVHDARWCLSNIQLGPRVGWGRVPTYAVLNLSRVAGYLDDRTIRSKLEGGEWALNRFGEEGRQVITEALKEYRRPGSSDPVRAEAVAAFAVSVASLFSSCTG
jgi:streptomycin 3"-adenylyltransferase